MNVDITALRRDYDAWRGLWPWHDDGHAALLDTARGVARSCGATVPDDAGLVQCLETARRVTEVSDGC